MTVGDGTVLCVVVGSEQVGGVAVGSGTAVGVAVGSRHVGGVVAGSGVVGSGVVGILEAMERSDLPP